jgi:phenylalanyl-tRNA synthetase alpha chain
MDTRKIIESLSPNEIKILPYIKEKTVKEISAKSKLDEVSVIRSLEYLKNKEIVKLDIEKKKIIELGVNGLLYKSKGLPERRLLHSLNEKKVLSFSDAKSSSKISDEELKASIGILIRRKAIELRRGKIFLLTNAEISKKTSEELLIESLPKSFEDLDSEEKNVLKLLEKRKELVRIKEEKTITISATALGNELSGMKIKSDSIEQITPEILRKGSWKGKKFRAYDVKANVPEIYGGKRHFVNQTIDYGRKVWTEMGFKEMTGDMVQSSFWNFDALFTAQDHPVREMQDTFYIDKKTNLPDKKIVNAVIDSHEGKLKGIKSKGWGYEWNEEEAKRIALRTHTTVLSVQTLSKLKSEGLPLKGKFFALGRCFRNETVDWSHGFEFNQTEGIVVDPDANFRHLLGYLKQFFEKMGFEKIRFRPAYFPYTEPSVEIDAFHKERKVWLELGGAGIFRPEVVVPLLGKNIPVLAWGPGFDRILMDYYEIKDLRELYKNNIDQLRNMKAWVK